MLPWYNPQVQTWHPCPSVQTKVLFWGRKNALEHWITSCWFLLPACLLHSPALSLHKTFARAQQARLSSEALGSKKPPKLTLMSYFWRNQCNSSKSLQVFWVRAKDLSATSFPPVLLSRTFQTLLFLEKAQIRSEQISMLSLSGQSSFKAALAHTIFCKFFFEKGFGLALLQDISPSRNSRSAACTVSNWLHRAELVLPSSKLSWFCSSLTWSHFQWCEFFFLQAQHLFYLF